MSGGTLLNVAKPFEGWKEKAEQWLYSQYPRQIDSGWYNSISIGANKDSAVGERGRFRIRGASTQNSGIYLETPDRMIPNDMLADPLLRVPSAVTRIADSVTVIAEEKVTQLVNSGMDVSKAKAKVADSISKFGYFDPKIGKYVAEPVIRAVNDSILSGMQTPYWNISRIQKIFRQPFLRGYSDHLVSKVGVPNIWADLVQIFTESFEGFARVSAAGHTTGDLNTTIAAKNRTSTMLTEIINLVIDYESPSPNEEKVGSQEGNWLTGAVISDRDAYANLMLEQLMTTLLYFGHPETGFEGLTQIADRDDAYDYYPSDKPPAQYLWDHDGAGGGTPVNPTVGADLLLMLNHLIADKMEELQFLPVSCRVACSPILWKALKFSMLSKTFNQNNPLSIINNAFESGNKISATLAVRSGEGLYRSFEMVPDPMLMPNTPFNTTDEDLMFITFPTLQSELEGSQLTDLVMAPMPIDKMVLPSAPGYRDGLVRTCLKRIGSLLCPVRKTVHVISGMGTNARYTPPAA
jgi:hypothetical protein